MYRTVVLLWVVFAVCESHVVPNLKQTGPCSCQSDAGVVDLTPLALNNGTPAESRDMTETEGTRCRNVPDGGITRCRNVPFVEMFQIYKYNHLHDLLGRDLFSWNPCVPFTQAACKDAAVCRYSGTQPGVVVGTQQSARFVSNKVEGLSLEYSQGEVVVSIKLKCTQEAKPDALWITGQVSGSGPYVMTLFSSHACPRLSDLEGGMTTGPAPSGDNTTTFPPFPTFPTPGVVTMTAKPSSLKTVTLLLSVEVLATVFILIVAVIGLVILVNRKLRQNRASPPAYGQLVIGNDDDDDDAFLLKL